jgi:hypothetical protein
MGQFLGPETDIKGKRYFMEFVEKKTTSMENHLQMEDYLDF